MPVHLNSFVPEEKNVNVFAALLSGDYLDRPETIYMSEDQKYLHMGTPLCDAVTETPIGDVVFTIEIKEKALEILDVDLTLRGSEPVKLRFDKQYPWSSDSNEYWFAFTDENDQAVEVETVYRYAVHMNLQDTVQPVCASAFPFRVEVFEDLQAASKAYGFDHPIKVPALGDDFEVSLYSPTFSSPGSMFRKEGSEESFSFLFGTVQSIRPAELQLGEERIRFLIVDLDTAFGILPTAMSEETFDLQNLVPGAVVVMYADIKADLSPAATKPNIVTEKAKGAAILHDEEEDKA